LQIEEVKLQRAFIERALGGGGLDQTVDFLKIGLTEVVELATLQLIPNVAVQEFQRFTLNQRGSAFPGRKSCEAMRYWEELQPG
jgi:hypothetical protein